MTLPPAKSLPYLINYNMRNWKNNVHIVLVEPKESGNIGASARAIKNMGFRNLCLVGPPRVMTGEAEWFACNALDVLRSAQKFPSVAEAVKDKSVIVGTTRRTGKKRGLIVSVEDGVRRVYETAAQNRVAILFGREDRGLFNEEVEECGFLMTVPTSKDQPSLNLSHAVMIIAYELSRAEFRHSPAGTPAEGNRARLVHHEELAALYVRINDVLKILEYIPRGNRDLGAKIMKNLKHFIGRAGITDWELKMLHGIITQIERKLCPKS